MSRHPSKGFTLLELLIVLTIMVIIMSLGIPSLRRSYEKAAFKDGVFALQTELNRTRLLAMKSGIPYVFHYCETTGEYEVVPKETYQNRIQQANAASAIGGSLLTPNSTGSDPADPNSLGAPQDPETSEININNLSSSSSDAKPSLLTPESDLTDLNATDLNTIETNTSNTDFNSGNVMVSSESGTSMQQSVTISTGTAETKRAILPDGVIFCRGLVSDMTPANLQSKEMPQSEQEIEVGLDSSFAGSLHPEDDINKVETQWSDPILFYPNGRTSQAVMIVRSPDDEPYYAEIALRGLTGMARISGISTLPPTDPLFPSVLTPEQIEMLQKPKNAPEDENLFMDSNSFNDSNF